MTRARWLENNASWQVLRVAAHLFARRLPNSDMVTSSPSRPARLGVRMESLLLSCRALSSPATCRFIPAHFVPFSLLFTALRASGTATVLRCRRRARRCQRAALRHLPASLVDRLFSSETLFACYPKMGVGLIGISSQTKCWSCCILGGFLRGFGRVSAEAETMGRQTETQPGGFHGASVRPLQHQFHLRRCIWRRHG